MADDGALGLSELHDARLLSLDLNWETGDVTLLFELDDGSSRIPIAGGPARFAPTEPGPAAIIVREAVDVRAPRLFDWGPSEYVDEARWAMSAEDDGGTLEIQMQSGDLLIVRGRTLEADRR